jgi:hypothetical protein
VLSSVHEKEATHQARDLHKQVLDCLDQHSRAANLELAHRISTLPQELRDMVYTNTWLGREGKRGGPYGEICRDFVDQSELLVLQDTCPGPPCRCMKKLPHFVDLNFMGTQVAREMLVHLRTIAVPYAHIRSYLGVKALMQKDIYHVGFAMMKILENANFGLKFGACFFYLPRHEGLQKLAWRQGQEKMQTAADLLMQFASMAGDPGRGKALSCYRLNINLDIYDDPETALGLELLASIFGPCFAEIHDEGFPVLLGFCSRSDTTGYWIRDPASPWSFEKWKKELLFQHKIGNKYEIVAHQTRTLQGRHGPLQKSWWQLNIQHIYNSCARDSRPAVR